MQLALVTAHEVVLEVHPGLGHPVAQGGGVLGQEGTVVDGGRAGKAQELLLAAFAHAVLGRAGHAPAYVHLVQVGFGVAQARQGQAADHGRLGVGDDHLVGGAQHFLPQGAEEVEVVRTGTQGGFLHHAVDVAEGEVVLRGDVQVLGAMLDELGRGALAGLEAAFDGGAAFGRDDRVVAVGEHEALVGQTDGLGTAGTALGDDGDDGHAQAGHGVDVAGDLLGRAGVVLDGIGTGREDVAVDGDAFGLGHTHVLQGLGVAPGLHGAAVAELGAVALFLADDHDGLGVHLLAAAAGDDRTGDEHAGVEAVLVLAAHFGEVVVDVLQDVTQADTLGMAHDAHAVHGRDELFQAFFHEDEKVFQGNDLGMGILDLAVAHTGGELGQLLVQQADAVLVLAGEDVARIREPVVQALDAFFDSVVHNLLRRLTLMEGDRRGGPSARSAGCGRCWPAGSPRWT